MTQLAYMRQAATLAHQENLGQYRYSDEVWDAQLVPVGRTWYRPEYGAGVVIIGWFIIATLLLARRWGLLDWRLHSPDRPS